jgi:hypothetical protein
MVLVSALLCFCKLYLVDPGLEVEGHQLILIEDRLELVQLLRQ